VAVAIIDGLSLPPGPPNLPFIAAYMKPFVIEETGGYLGSEWTRIRDFQRWFPWFAKTKETRQGKGAGSMESLHEYTMDLLMAGPHFSDAYGAAMRYQALPVVSSLRARTAFMCRQDDVLHAYLASLPNPLPAGCTMESIAPDKEQWRKRVRELFTEYADWKGAAHFTPPDPFVATGDADQVLCTYVDVPGGQMLVRRAGAAKAGKPIVYLHDLPGSARADEHFLKALAAASGRPVYALDLPGCNETSAPAAATGDAIAPMLEAAVTTLGLTDIDVVAIGLSTAFAALIAQRGKIAVGRLLLDGAFIANADLRTEMKINYTPDLRPQQDGLHLHRAFHMLRDQEIAWPWYDGSSASIRRITPDLDPVRLYMRLVDTLKQYQHYADAVVAACDLDVGAILGSLRQEIIACTRTDDVRYAAAATLPGRRVERPDAPDARAAAFAKVLAG
jgi:pimeloyl-ACP methyl ester carboxylesterase